MDRKTAWGPCIPSSRTPTKHRAIRNASLTSVALEGRKELDVI